MGILFCLILACCFFGWLFSGLFKAMLTVVILAVAWVVVFVVCPLLSGKPDNTSEDNLIDGNPD